MVPLVTVTSVPSQVNRSPTGENTSCVGRSAATVAGSRPAPATTRAASAAIECGRFHGDSFVPTVNRRCPALEQHEFRIGKRVSSRAGQCRGEGTEVEVLGESLVRAGDVVDVGIRDLLGARHAVSKRVGEEGVPDHPAVAHDDIALRIDDHEGLPRLDGDELIDRALDESGFDLVKTAVWRIVNQPPVSGLVTTSTLRKVSRPRNASPSVALMTKLPRNVDTTSSWKPQSLKLNSSLPP